jgi:hypothetical protein
MSRVRLTSRTAEDLKSKAGTQVSDKGTGIDNDPYDINDTGHSKADPKIDEYAKGDPEAWAEGVNKDNPAKDDSKREPATGHAPLIDKHAAAEAIASAKKLEEKAVKCIIAAQRILPGAPEAMLEKQAAILMNLPEEGLNATLAHQEELAKMIGKSAGESAEEAEEKEEKDEKDEDKKKEAAEAEKKAKEKLEALKKEASELEKKIEAGQNDPKYWYGEGQSMKDVSKKSKDAAEEKKEDKKEEKKEESKEAGKKEDKKEKKEEDKKEKEAAEEEKKDEEKKEDKEAAKEEEKKEEDKKEDKEAAKEEEKKEDKKEEEKKEEDKEASDATILDDIFGLVTASENKKGAAKISGMVKKQASEQIDDLTGIWRTDPDVSKVF